MKLSEEEKEDITDMVIESRDVEEELTADEMFKRLNWNKSENFSNCFSYTNKQLVRVTFWKSTKKLTIMGDITMKELQAINKKVEELGWI